VPAELVTMLRQPPDHAGTHARQSDHAVLHVAILSMRNEREWVVVE
jgi:hypothetical protein